MTCITIAVVDLNRVFSSKALDIDASLTTKVLPARSQATQASATSFTDALAGIQNSLTASQSETPDSAILAQQFQNGTSCRPLTHSRQNQNGSDIVDATPQETQPARKQGREDVHARGRTTALNADNHPTPKAKVARHLDEGESEATRNTTRSKQHKATSHSAKEASAPEDVHDANPAPVEDPTAKQLGTTVEETRQDPTAAVDRREASTSSAVPPGNARLNNKDGDLAFAMKVQGNNAATEGRPAPMNQASLASLQAPDLSAQLASQAGVVATMPVTDQDAKTSKAEQQDAEGLPMMPEAVLPAPSMETVGATPTTSQPEVTKVSEIPQEPVAPVQPVKAVQVQIAGADNQRVDLRLIERSGLLTMSVRSSDRTLTKALQQNLPDLAGKLNDQQIRAEWWKPGIAQAEPGQTPEAPAHKEVREQTENQQSNQDRNGQQSRRKTPRPDWVDELTNSRKSNQMGTQYTWHL